MKKREKKSKIEPRRIVFHDEKNDEFSTAQIEPKKNRWLVPIREDRRNSYNSTYFLVQMRRRAARDLLSEAQIQA